MSSQQVPDWGATCATYMPMKEGTRSRSPQRQGAVEEEHEQEEADWSPVAESESSELQ